MNAPRNKPPSRQVGAKALVGSQAARAAAAIVLESVTGLCSVEEASARLAVAVPRYYVLETRALQGLIGALEPRARGRPLSEASKLAALTKENARLSRELRRYQALHRAATRAMGVAPLASTPVHNGGKRRRRRRQARAERVIAILRRGEGEGAQVQAQPPKEEAVS